MKRAPSQYRLHTFFVLTWFASCVNVSNAYAQIPLDTSYTVASTYRKLIKQYPEIIPASLKSTDQVTVVNDLVYRSLASTPFGKRDLHADVFMPGSVQRKFPAIVMIHGGGWRAGNKSLNSVMAQRLAANNFVVVSVEYRLSLEAKYPAAIHDVKAAIRWIREHADQYNVDTAKIALAGYSAGGQMASLIGVTQRNTTFEDEGTGNASSNRVHAVIDMDGLLDFTHAETLAVKRTETSADVSWLGGNYQEIPERWKEASPIVWVDRDAPPFLFINSSQTRFHAGCAEMINQLSKLGIYSEVHKFNDAPHSYWFFHPWFDPTIGYITSFLNKIFNSKGE